MPTTLKAGEKFDTGALIRKLRGNLSQQEFAKEMGVGRTTVIRYESNERVPDPEFLLRLNVRYRVDPLHVLTGLREHTSNSLQDDEIELLKDYKNCDEADRLAVRNLVASLAAKSGRK